MSTNIETMATLWPDMPHYEYFAKHPKMDGIRLNTAMADVATMPSLMKQAVAKSYGTPLYFDIKGRQLRVTKVCSNKDYLEIDINHPIELDTPTVVLFKAGADSAVLAEVKDGTHLIFNGGPKYNLRSGESLNIRSPSLKVIGPLFTEQQLTFLSIAKSAGITRYMLSYATSVDEMNELRALVGEKSEIIAKIESPAGLKFADSHTFGANEHILTARGDLFVELSKPHQILNATRQLIKKDPKAILGSRILLSVTEESVPSCADINEIAWLLDIGYRRFMFCDGLCLDKEALERAINIMHAIASDYISNSNAVVTPIGKTEKKGSRWTSSIFTMFSR